MLEAAELCGDQLTCDWRQEIPSVANMYQCPDNAFYSGCAPGCQDTCFDPLASTRYEKGIIFFNIYNRLYIKNLVCFSKTGFLNNFSYSEI